MSNAICDEDIEELESGAKPAANIDTDTEADGDDDIESGSRGADCNESNMVSLC